MRTYLIKGGQALICGRGENMATVELTKDNLDSTIANNSIVLIDFWAEWCGPCKMFGPIFEKASDTHPDIVFAKCNTDKEQEIASAFGVQSIPTIAILRDQIPVFVQAGALPASTLETVIQRVKELDMNQVRAEVTKMGGQQAGQAGGAKAPQGSPERGRPGAGGFQSAAKRPAAGGAGTPQKKPPAAPTVVTVQETSKALAALADDPLLRRQGISREFLQSLQNNSSQEPGQEVARRVLQIYERLRQLIREHGEIDGRPIARREFEQSGLDAEKELAGLPVEIRSEARAVLRAINELISG
jgi:thioredoxin 1